MIRAFLSLAQLAGGVILGVALWLRHDSQTSNLLILQFEGHQAPGTFYISEYTGQSPSHSTFERGDFTEGLKLMKPMRSCRENVASPVELGCRGSAGA